MDVLSALIAYEQKLTMRLSSPSFYCRLLGSKTLLFWVSVQIPSSGALPVRCDGLRGSYNGNWVGRWTNSDSAKGARYQQHTRLLLFILSLLKWRDFNWFCFLLQCWLMSQWGGSCVLRACGTERGGVGLSHCLCRAAETQRDLWLPICAKNRWDTVSLSLVRRVERVTSTFSVKGSLCIPAIFICFAKKAFAFIIIC